MKCTCISTQASIHALLTLQSPRLACISVCSMYISCICCVSVMRSARPDSRAYAREGADCVHLPRACSQGALSCRSRGDVLRRHCTWWFGAQIQTIKTARACIRVDNIWFILLWGMHINVGTCVLLLSVLDNPDFTAP
jgi:hypothetical protein